MARLLVLAPGPGSRAEPAIVANLVRRLPRDRFGCAFVTASGGETWVQDLGYPALPLAGDSPAARLDALDRIVAGFRPDQLLVADEPALVAASTWSGLDLAGLRERYQRPLVCLDRYGRGTAAVNVDGYGQTPRELPALADRCDLVLRCAPPYRADRGDGSIPVALVGGGLRGAASLAPPPDAARPAGPITVFVSDPVGATAPEGPAGALADALPRILCGHLEALDRPLRLFHVGGVAWDIPLPERLEYQHLLRLPPALYRDRLLAADLYLTVNAASLSLAEAVLSGVPALVLNQSDELASADFPAWLADAAPDLATLHPFWAFPWGWHRMLTDAFRDNPYPGCFRTAGLADRSAVLAAATELLDDTAVRTTLYERQLGYRATLDALPSLADVLSFAGVR